MAEELIEKINKEIEELKAKIAPVADMQKNISELKRVRDELNGKVKELSEKIKNTKQIRDSYNQVVKSAKNIRDSVQKKISEVRKDLPKKGAGDKGRRKPTYKNIRKQIKDLEWKIQTSGVSFSEERNLRNQLQKLEILKAELQREEDARSSSRKLSSEAKKHHARVLEFSIKSRSIHKELLELYGELKKIRAKATQKHEEFLEKVKALDIFNKEHESDFNLLNELKQKLRQEKKKLAAKQEENLEKGIVERAQDAFEKLKQGVRVDLRDLQAKLKLEEKKNKKARN